MEQPLIGRWGRLDGMDAGPVDCGRQCVEAGIGTNVKERAAAMSNPTCQFRCWRPEVVATFRTLGKVEFHVESTTAVGNSVADKSFVDRMSSVCSVEVVSIVVETVPVVVISDKLCDVITTDDVVRVVDGKIVDSAFSVSALSSE